MDTWELLSLILGFCSDQFDIGPQQVKVIP